MNVMQAQAAAAQTTASSANTAQVSTATTQTSSNPALNSDFETFLKMLTAQMQNQDPLNPMDSTEFASQLAQFSSVEQQVLTNEHLVSLANQLAILGAGNMASWIGMEARMAGPAHFTGEDVEVMPMANSAADEAFLIVRDAEGNEVQRFAIDPEDEVVVWTGTDDEGNDFPEGLYTFETLSRADGADLDRVTAEVYTLISEAQGGPQGTVLVVEGGARIPASEIISLRQPA